MINQISDFKKINNIERNRNMNVILISSYFIILLMSLDEYFSFILFENL